MTKHQLAALITKVLGECCAEHDEGCMTCAAWWMLREIERLDADAAAEKAEAASWKAVAHDHSERLQRLANKCAALTLVAYGTPENPRDPLAPGGTCTAPNIAAPESGTGAASQVDTHDPAGMARWLRERAESAHEFLALDSEAQQRHFLQRWQQHVLPHLAFRFKQAAEMIERLQNDIQELTCGDPKFASSRECICPVCGLRHGGSNLDGGF